MNTAFKVFTILWQSASSDETLLANSSLTLVVYATERHGAITYNASHTISYMHKMPVDNTQENPNVNPNDDDFLSRVSIFVTCKKIKKNLFISRRLLDTRCSLYA